MHRLSVWLSSTLTSWACISLESKVPSPADRVAIRTDDRTRSWTNGAIGCEAEADVSSGAGQ